MNKFEALFKELPDSVDAALITGDVNRRYFTGMKSSAGMVLACKDKAYLIIDFRYIEVARAKVKDAEVILREKLYDQLNELLKKHGARTLAIESEKMTVAELELYRSKLPEVELISDSSLSKDISKLRIVKTHEEIDSMIKA